MPGRGVSRAMSTEMEVSRSLSQHSTTDDSSTYAVSPLRGRSTGTD